MTRAALMGRVERIDRYRHPAARRRHREIVRSLTDREIAELVTLGPDELDRRCRELGITEELLAACCAPTWEFRRLSDADVDARLKEAMYETGIARRYPEIFGELVDLCGGVEAVQEMFRQRRERFARP